MDEIVSLFAEADKADDIRKQKLEEVLQATEMRKMSLETFKESLRINEGQTPPAKRRRASSSDTMSLLRERMEMEAKQRMERIELRKTETDMEKEMREADLTLSLPRVITFKFLLQPHQKYHITQYGELGFS